MTQSTEFKITRREDAAKHIAEIRAAGKVVGYTSGVFDILHPGHILYLEQARERCDFLVVGVNSDMSVRQLKGAKRPICTEQERSRVLAALACVDLIFIFGEQNNNLNIELLKPSVYFKAGDYNLSQLSSKSIIEAQGGRVELLSFKPGSSSTDIIEKISHLAHPAFSAEQPLANLVLAPAVFVDRDGTINVLREYLSDVKDFELIPGALEGLKMLQQAGYRIVITTNQPGIGLGYFTREDMYRIHSRFLSYATKESLMIDKIYMCPHSESEKCSCRKPAPGMIDRAVSELNIDRAKSFVIGDMTSDIAFARNAGCKSVLVQTGKAGSDGRYDNKADHVCASLREAAEKICSLS